MTDGPLPYSARYRQPAHERLKDSGIIEAVFSDVPVPRDAFDDILDGPATHAQVRSEFAPWQARRDAARAAAAPKPQQPAPAAVPAAAAPAAADAEAVATFYSGLSPAQRRNHQDAVIKAMVDANDPIELGPEPAPEPDELIEGGWENQWDS